MWVARCVPTGQRVMRRGARSGAAAAPRRRRLWRTGVGGWLHHRGITSTGGDTFAGEEQARETSLRAFAHSLVASGVCESVDEARLEVRFLADAAFGGSSVSRLPSGPLPTLRQLALRDTNVEEQALLEEMIGKRAGGVPVAYVTGVKDFWDFQVHVDENTLIPRSDSETLVAATVDHWQGRGASYDDSSPSVLDLYTGSGVLLCALLREISGSTGLGVDVSGAALDVARRNAADLGCAGRSQFLEVDIDQLQLRDAGSFDVIIANPPYIESTIIDSLDATVREHEPHLALDGGSDGLRSYRAIAALLAQGDIALNPGGLLILEIGAGQRDDVVGIIAGRGAREDDDDGEEAAVGSVGMPSTPVSFVESRKDIGGVDRCLVFRRLE